MGFIKNRTIGLLFVFILLAAVSLTVLVAQQRQETRQRASEVECGIEPPLELEDCEKDVISCRDKCLAQDVSCHLACRDEYNLCLNNNHAKEYNYDQWKKCVVKAQIPSSESPTATPIPTTTATDSSASSDANPTTDTPTPVISVSTPTITPTLIPTTVPTLNPTLSLSPTSFIPSPTPTIAAISCSLKNKGDADCNDKIDEEDKRIWIEEFVSEVIKKIATSRKSDFNKSETITIADFNIWKTGFEDQSLSH